MSIVNFPVTPEIFWNTFSKKFRKKWFDNEKNSHNCYGVDKNWTPKMWTDWMEELLTSFNDDFNCETNSSEYWPRVDFGYFDKCTDNEWMEWALEIAIEHENEMWPNWQDECRKLMMINAGLKVLITYRIENKELLEQHLDEFIAIYKSRKYHTEFDNWLFIFGPNMEIWNETDFVAYKFDGNVRKEITNNIKTFSNL